MKGENTGGGEATSTPPEQTDETGKTEAASTTGSTSTEGGLSALLKGENTGGGEATSTPPEQTDGTGKTEAASTTGSTPTEGTTGTEDTPGTSPIEVDPSSSFRSESTSFTWITEGESSGAQGLSGTPGSTNTNPIGDAAKDTADVIGKATTLATIDGGGAEDKVKAANAAKAEVANLEGQLGKASSDLAIAVLKNDGVAIVNANNDIEDLYRISWPQLRRRWLT